MGMPLELLFAIIVLCVACIALMILVMIAASPTPAWYRRLNLGSVAMGLVMVAFGVFQFSMARNSEQSGRPSRYRGAPVTPAQSYAVAIGFVVLGSAAAVAGLIYRKRGPDDTSTSPTT